MVAAPPLGPPRPAGARAACPPECAIAEVPTHFRVQARALFRSTAHWRPLLNGRSGFYPVSVFAESAVAQSIPRGPGRSSTSEPRACAQCWCVPHTPEPGHDAPARAASAACACAISRGVPMPSCVALGDAPPTPASAPPARAHRVADRRARRRRTSTRSTGRSTPCRRFGCAGPGNRPSGSRSTWEARARCPGIDVAARHAPPPLSLVVPGRGLSGRHHLGDARRATQRRPPVRIIPHRPDAHRAAHPFSHDERPLPPPRPVSAAAEARARRRTSGFTHLGRRRDRRAGLSGARGAAAAR